MRIRPGWIAAGFCALGAAAISSQSAPPRVMTLDSVLKGSKEEQLRWPVAVAASADDRIAVADAYGPALFLFRRVGVSWTLERTVELAGAPAGLAWNGERYVLSLRQQRELLTLQEDGSTAGTIQPPPGVVPGPLAALPGGGLLLYDAAGSQIRRLDQAGQAVDSTTVDGIVTALAGDGQGGFLAAIGDESRLLRGDGAGEIVDSWSLPPDGPVPAWPTGLATAPGGEAVVVDRHNGRLLVLDRDGNWIGLGSREGWDAGLLRRPAGLARLPSGSLVVADQGNGRVQIFRLIADRLGS